MFHLFSYFFWKDLSPSRTPHLNIRDEQEVSQVVKSWGCMWIYLPLPNYSQPLLWESKRSDNFIVFSFHKVCVITFFSNVSLWGEWLVWCWDWSGRGDLFYEVYRKHFTMVWKPVDSQNLGSGVSLRQSWVLVVGLTHGREVIWSSITVVVGKHP